MDGSARICQIHPIRCVSRAHISLLTFCLEDLSLAQSGAHCVSVLSCLQICSSWLHPLGAVMGARLDLPLLHPVIDFTLHRSAITFGSLVTTCALKSLSSDVATSPCSRTWRVFLLPSLSARVGLDAATRLCRQPVVESPKDPLSRCGLLTGEVNPFIFQLSPDR